MASVRPSPIRQRVFSKAVKQQGKAHTEAEDCAICMVKFKQGDEVVTLSCPHVFHWKCLQPWLKKNATCPTCRIPLQLPKGFQTAQDAELGSFPRGENQGGAGGSAPSLRELALQGVSAANWGWGGSSGIPGYDPLEGQLPVGLSDQGR